MEIRLEITPMCLSIIFDIQRSREVNLEIAPRTVTTDAKSLLDPVI